MVKKILLISSVLIVGILCFFGWFLNQMRELRPIETAKISDTIFAVKGKIGNLFLVKTNDGYIAFDAADNFKAVVAGCTKLSVSPELVKAVFLTHSDADHTAGIGAFKNATVYLSRDEVPLITKKIPRHFLFFKHFNSLPVSHYLVLSDRDSVTIGEKIVHAVATPGHTAGSMCYRVDGDLFTGDLCILKKGIIFPMLKIFTEDMSMDSTSIRSVAKMANVKSVYTAHSGYTSDFAAAFASWQ